MAIYKKYRTWLHVLLEYWDAFRNASWAEALPDLFAKPLPDTRMLNLQTDGTADTALTLAVRSTNVLVTRRLLEGGADPNIPIIRTVRFPIWS